jgi:hypothetical protein
LTFSHGFVFKPPSRLGNPVPPPKHPTFNSRRRITAFYKLSAVGHQLSAIGHQPRADSYNVLMADMLPAIQALERDLRGVFGDRLRSIVAVGVHGHGAGSQQTHDAHAAHDDRGRWLAETLVVVDAIGHDDLSACASRVQSWHDAGLATPLLLAADELARSLDTFPLEFGAMIADHVVVFGSNPFDGLRVDAADLRRGCEIQARSHLLHLREGYVETRGRADALADLIVRSAPAFAALLQSLARLQGVASHDRGAVGRHVERLLNAPGAVTDVLKLATVTEISSDEAVRLFPAYLDAVARLVRYVDTWSGR